MLFYIELYTIILKIDMKLHYLLISKVITCKLENASFLATSATLILPICEPVLCTLGQDPV